MHLNPTKTIGLFLFVSTSMFSCTFLEEELHSKQEGNTELVDSVLEETVKEFQEEIDGTVEMGSSDALEDIGLIKSITDGQYPMYIVRVDFPKREMTIDFDLNLEEISLNAESLYALKGQYVRFFYSSELKNNLYDIHYKGKSLFGTYAPEFDANWNKITGKLSGADYVTAGDLPDKISITNDGKKLDFELFIHEEITPANGKIVEVYYGVRAVNKILKILPSQD